MEHSQQYMLGSWKICPQTNTISNKADSQAIDNKSMQVLLFLIQHAGEHVTKDQIFEHVWKDSFVADDILSVAVSKIRKALGDNARSPTFIKTLPGVGYCLIAKVENIDNTNQAHNSNSQPSIIYIGIITLLLIAAFLLMNFLNTDEGSPANRIHVNSIAVLPFDDLSSEKDNQYFTDGLSDAIINQLSQIKSLKVISRYSSFTYRGNYNATEIGQALQVDTLLDGSVQRIGEQVRINIRIFSTNNGQQLWSKTFDSDIQNSFKLQDNISTAIQEIIQPNFKPVSKPNKAVSAQAYEWYLMGQYHWRQRNPKSLSKAVTYFKHSLDLEPDYAEAHVGIAITYANLHNFANWSEKKAVDKALPHIEKALELKPNSPTALAAKGMILTLKANYEFSNSTSIQLAQQAFLQSLELEDNATTHRWYSMLLKMLGNKSQVIQHLNQAIALNPLSGSLKRTLSIYLQRIGKPDSAQRMYQRAFILEPEHFSHVIESTHVFRHTPKSIMSLAEWHAANAELFLSCSSDEYCEQLVLAYLSIGANEVANNILDKMGPKHGHFIYSLDLINFGLKGEDQKILSKLERLATRYPNHRKLLSNLAVVQFRTENYQQAKSTLSKLYPEWPDPVFIEQGDITADNYSALVLYAATLSNLGSKESADKLLQNLHVFLTQDKVFDKIQAEFSLAEINVQLNNTTQALHHLAAALEMGWLESYDLEWWPLQNNHLLQPMHEEPEFKLLIDQHQKKLIDLREQIARKLGSTQN